MAPKEGNSIVKHGVVDERLNVHGVKNLKVCDLSICPDNVGCNTYSVRLPSLFSPIFKEVSRLTYPPRLPCWSVRSAPSSPLRISATLAAPSR